MRAYVYSMLAWTDNLCLSTAGRRQFREPPLNGHFGVGAHVADHCEEDGRVPDVRDDGAQEAAILASEFVFSRTALAWPAVHNNVVWNGAHTVEERGKHVIEVVLVNDNIRRLRLIRG